MSPELALRRPALYTPSLWSRDEIRAYFVARQGLLARLVDDLRREQPGTRPQHRLILGQGGMGKSALLCRLAIAVEDDPELPGQWLPLVFPEAQYNVATLADFWRNCLSSLGDSLEARDEPAAAIDAGMERIGRNDAEGALQALLRMAKQLDRRLLLLVDNLDRVLERIRDHHWALREALQAHPELLLVGTASRALEATYDYGAAFYDFFRIDELRGLPEAEMRETLLALARLGNAGEMAQRVESDPGRLRVLHALTGGNPRTAVLLYGVLLKGIQGSLASDLEALLDELTPLFKARIDALPPQAQQLLDALARQWDPMTARQLADALGWTVNLASAQLERLAVAGVVEKVRAGSGKRMAFQVGERLFNLWYLMRTGRSGRRRLGQLVEFLHAFSGLDGERPASTGLVAEPAPGAAGQLWAEAMNHFAGGQAEEACQAAGRWFARLGESTQPSAGDLQSLLALLKTTCTANCAAPVLAQLDASPAAQAFRPAREALAAVAAESPTMLNGVAPEVRQPATAVLKLIAPQLLEPAA